MLNASLWLETSTEGERERVANYSSSSWSLSASNVPVIRSRCPQQATMARRREREGGGWGGSFLLASAAASTHSTKHLKRWEKLKHFYRGQSGQSFGKMIATPLLQILGQVVSIVSREVNNAPQQVNKESQARFWGSGASFLFRRVSVGCVNQWGTNKKKNKNKKKERERESKKDDRSSGVFSHVKWSSLSPGLFYRSHLLSIEQVYQSLDAINVPAIGWGDLLPDCMYL